MLTGGNHAEEVFHKKTGAQVQHVGIGEFAGQQLLKVVKPAYHAGIGPVRAKAAQRYDMLHARGFQRCHDGLSHDVLIGAKIGRLKIGGNERIDGIGACKGFCEKSGVVEQTRGCCGALLHECCEVLCIAPDCDELMACGEELKGEGLAGIAARAGDDILHR